MGSGYKAPTRSMQGGMVKRKTAKKLESNIELKVGASLNSVNSDMKEPTSEGYSINNVLKIDGINKDTHQS